MADAREAFAKALHEGHELEHDQRWQDAVDVYSKLLGPRRIRNRVQCVPSP